MISKAKAYFDSTGKVHGTLEAAQQAELFGIFPVNESSENGGGVKVWNPEAIVVTIFTNADKIKDVLSTRPTSRPGARKVNKAGKDKSARPEVVKRGLAEARKAVDAA